MKREKSARRLNREMRNSLQVCPSSGFCLFRPPIENGEVVVCGDRIEAVRAAGETGSEPVTDFGDAVLMPGTGERSYASGLYPDARSAGRHRLLSLDSGADSS